MISLTNVDEEYAGYKTMLQTIQYARGQVYPPKSAELHQDLFGTSSLPKCVIPGLAGMTEACKTLGITVVCGHKVLPRQWMFRDQQQFVAMPFCLV